MLGISFINEIVQKREITNPADILAELRRQIKQTLKQTGEKGEADDGMDMALIALDNKTKILQYAGANNSLYLVQDGELEEIRADKMPVGFYPNEKPEFTNHEIQLKTNDIFYLFSDGFIDQFGGENNKKYGTKAFRDLLLSVQNEKIEKQGEIISNKLQEWKQNTEQLDDILILGFEV